MLHKVGYQYLVITFFNIVQAQLHSVKLHVRKEGQIVCLTNSLQMAPSVNFLMSFQKETGKMLKVLVMEISTSMLVNVRRSLIIQLLAVLWQQFTLPLLMLQHVEHYVLQALSALLMIIYQLPVQPI